MKRIALVLSAVLLAAVFAGCTASASTANYRDVLYNARSTEENNALYIVTDAETQAAAETSFEFSVEGGVSVELPPLDEFDARQRQNVFNDMTGFSEDSMRHYAISLGFSITQAYAVAIVLPAEGKAEDVKTAMEEYVLTQQKAQENYLPAQYEIAKNAIIKQAKSGEMLLVMCAGADELCARIEKALAGK